MQSLSSCFVPVALLALLSIVSCSSKTQTNQKGAKLTDDSLVTSNSSSGLLDDASDLVSIPLSGSLANDSLINDSLINNDEAGASDIVTQPGSSGSTVGVNDAGLNLHSANSNAINLNFASLSSANYEQIAKSAVQVMTLASSEPVAGQIGQADYSLTFTCDEGGSLNVALKDFNQGPFYHYRTSFDNCQWNGQNHHGGLESSGARRAPDVTIFREYTRTSVNQSITLNGEHAHTLPFFGNPESNIWMDTGYVFTNKAVSIKVNSINWNQEGADAPHLDTLQGFVLLPNGTIKRVAQYNYAANLQATFNFTPAQSQSDAMTVDVNLGYETNYFNWEGHYESGFDLPTFPVSDLGSSISVYSEFDIGAGTIELLDSLPKDATPQWQSGEVRITAPDSTSLVLKPDSNNAAAVLFELNNSGEQIPRLWADGFQVACPSRIGICS